MCAFRGTRKECVVSMEEKNVLLSLKDVEVKFRVRGRILTAIRGVSLDIYENESIAIVGESGSGKSVLTKTFAGMLDSNGFISNGEIILNDTQLQETSIKKNKYSIKMISLINSKLNSYSKLEFGSEIYKEILSLKAEKASKIALSEEESNEIDEAIAELNFQKTEIFNLKQTYDSRKEKDKMKEANERINE